MHFSCSIAFDFKMSSLSPFTHIHNKKGRAAEQGRQDVASCLWKPTSILSSFCF